MGRAPPRTLATEAGAATVGESRFYSIWFPFDRPIFRPNGWLGRLSNWKSSSFSADPSGKSRHFHACCQVIALSSLEEMPSPWHNVLGDDCAFTTA